MQASQLITLEQLDDVIAEIYKDGAPIVKEAYSQFDTNAVIFPTAADLRAAMQWLPGVRTFYQYAVYYPGAKGLVLERRIALKQARPGHTHRFKQEGWGLIHFQVTFKDRSHTECRLTANSRTRATKWSDTYPELNPPELWDWTVVNHHAGRLVRLLRELGKRSNSTSRRRAAATS